MSRAPIAPSNRHRSPRRRLGRLQRAIQRAFTADPDAVLTARLGGLRRPIDDHVLADDARLHASAEVPLFDPIFAFHNPQWRALPVGGRVPKLLPLLIPNFFNPSRAIWVHDSENDHRATSFLRHEPRSII